MVRAPRSRKASETEVYHVVSRGVGRQIIFEDEEDRRCYIGLLQEETAKHRGEILAWCLMDNHAHLLLRMHLDELSESMKAINSLYVMRFNKRHGRVGHLMQGRFKSEPANSDEYLLTVVRYIHQNPEKAGLAKTDEYPWSSYREYTGEKAIASTSLILGMFGSVSEFERFHRGLDHAACCIDENRGRRVLDSDSALHAARSAVEPFRVEEIAALPKPQRNQMLCKLKEAGLSLRQIERLTGVSKSVVSKSKAGQ